MEAQYNPETARLYHFRYMREYRAVCVLWAVLTIIWATFNVVVFIQPQWIGDTYQSPGYGHHGVYKWCYPDNGGLGEYACSGSFTDFSTLLNDSYKATTFFVGVAALLMLISVAALLLFFCFKKTVVFVIVGIMEIITGMFSIVLVILSNINLGVYVYMSSLSSPFSEHLLMFYSCFFSITRNSYMTKCVDFCEIPFKNLCTGHKLTCIQCSPPCDHALNTLWVFFYMKQNFKSMKVLADLMSMTEKNPFTIFFFKHRTIKTCVYGLPHTLLLY